MASKQVNKGFAFLWAVFSLAFGLSWVPVSAQQVRYGLARHQHAGHQNGDAAGMPAPQQPPHGGQVTALGSGYAEVVYQPKQTRVYLFAPDGRPWSVRGARGEATMQVRGYDGKVFRYPLQYVAPPAGSSQQDYLAAAVDVSRIRDGDMTVTLDLTGLPNPQQPQARFTQTFALWRPPVRVAVLDQSDPPRIERQKTCPVSGGRLGSMGTPIKVLVGDQPLYLCCKGCLAKVQANPQAYLEKVSSARSPSAWPERLVVTTATAADQAAVEAQGTCPVMGTPLGRHGAPIKLSAGGQSLFVCCRGCVGKVQKNPDYYLAKAAQLRRGR